MLNKLKHSEALRSSEVVLDWKANLLSVNVNFRSGSMSNWRFSLRPSSRNFPGKVLSTMVYVFFAWYKFCNKCGPQDTQQDTALRLFNRK